LPGNWRSEKNPVCRCTARHFTPSRIRVFHGEKDIAIMLDSRRAAAASLYTERWIPRGSNQLYARDYPGSGPAFVMLHGFPDNLQIYDDLASILSAAGRRVITFDFLGYGKSDKPSGSLTVLTDRQKTWKSSPTLSTLIRS
jgi:hypothetical protein